MDNEQISVVDDQQSMAPDGALPAAPITTLESGDSQQQQSNADMLGTAHDPLTRVPRPDGAETSEGAAEPAAAADSAHSGGHPAPPQVTPDALAKLRDAFVALNPEVVAELIQGDTIEAVLSSLDDAKAAYARVRGEVEARVAGAVPRGGSSRTLDAAVLDSLSPSAKIAYALSQQQQA